MIWSTKKYLDFVRRFFEYRIRSKYVGVVGLIIGALGAFISAISFTESDGRVVSPVTHIPYHIAVIRGYGFRAGFFLLILGFFLQILEKVNSSEEYIELIWIIFALVLSVALYLWTEKLFSSFLFL